MTTACFDNQLGMASRSGRRGKAARLWRAPLWISRMIRDARTLPELDALKEPLLAWHRHPLYENLMSLFASRIRQLAAMPGTDEQPPPKPLTKHEARRATKRVIRTASIAELDSVVECLKLRYAAGSARDEVENFARQRRERLNRLAGAVDDSAPSTPATERRE
jgi:hypothetical protein